MTTYSLVNGKLTTTSTVNSNSAYLDKAIDKIANNINYAVDSVKTNSITDVLKKMEEDSKAKYIAAAIDVKYIYHSGEATVVYWADGTKTIVRRSPEEPNSDYTAFCAALAKKLYGSTTNVHSVIEDHLDVNIKAKKEADKLARRKAQEEIEKANHEKKVRALAKELRLLSEAQMYAAAHGGDC